MASSHECERISIIRYDLIDSRLTGTVTHIPFDIVHIMTRVMVGHWIVVEIVAHHVLTCSVLHARPVAFWNATWVHFRELFFLVDL